MEQGTVILPTYNERQNIVGLIQKIFHFYPRISVLVVDDNSPDGTAGVVKQLQTRYPGLALLQRAKKDGLGAAYIHAFHEVLRRGSAGCIIMMDADFSHDPRYLKTFFEHIGRYDIVVGSRYVPGGMTTGWELRRKVLSRMGNWYAKILTRMPVADCTGGFNCIRKEALERVHLDSLLSFKGYAFIIALKYQLWKSGARFKEVPIVFKNRTKGDSKISHHIIREGALTPWRLLLWH
jgi:dolichol-phosphate mannosyltransferase